MGGGAALELGRDGRVHTANADGVVTGFIPKGHATPSWHFVGIQVVNKRVFAALPDNMPIETVSGV